MDENLQTLRDILKSPPATRAHVVEFMVEVRKIVEDLPNHYTVLQFFGDWVVHGKLDREGAKTILKELDEFVRQMRSAKTQEEKQAYADERRPFLSLHKLQDDLAIFLAERGLDDSLVADEKHWQPFMSIYVDIISRAPLVAKAEDKKLMAALTEITSVKVQKLTTPAGATHRPGKTFQFRIAWTFYKDASQTFDISSDIWLPDVPVKRTFPALKQTTDNATGAVSVETYESKTFF